MDKTNLEKMLAGSVKASTLAKYFRLWDKWLAFSAFHEVDTMPPHMRALEIFISDTADLSGSAWVTNSTAGSVAHFCALEGYPSPFVLPRFSKIMRGVRLLFG
jgi:hypothetical protein